MASDKSLSEVLIAINSISNDKGLELGEKLKHILLEIVGCMKARSGSIMLVKGRKSLQMVASTNAELIGVKQPLLNGSKCPSRLRVPSANITSEVPFLIISTACLKVRLAFAGEDLAILMYPAFLIAQPRIGTRIISSLKMNLKSTGRYASRANISKKLRWFGT
ncbi:hypothetical protein ES703_76746 [subsurface metagenome]